MPFAETLCFYLAWVCSMFTKLSSITAKFLAMRLKAKFIRVMAIPACVVWCLLELFALQRARLLGRR